MKKALLLLAIILIGPVINSCKKKENVSPGVQPAALNLTLDQPEVYQASTITFTASGAITDFSNKILIDGVETAAVMSDEKYIVSAIGPDMAAGIKKITVTVNGHTFEYSLNVLALPTITNPDKSVGDYYQFMDDLKMNSLAAVDSLSRRLKLPNTPEFDMVKSGLAIIEDSLTLYKQKYNALAPEAKMICAKILVSEMKKLQPVYDFFAGYNEMIIKTDTYKKTGFGCAIPDDLSATTICILKKTKDNLLILMKESIANAMLGATVGGAVAVILFPVTGPVAWQAGAYVAFGTMAILNAKAVGVFLDVLIENFVDAWIVVEARFFPKKTSDQFDNGQPQPLNIKLQTRNLQPKDNTSSVNDIKDYLAQTTEFLSYVSKKMKAYFPAVPSFLAERSISTNTPQLKFISVEVQGNSNVQFAGLTGTPQNPEIKFTTTATEDQHFDYKVKYDDGVFKVEGTQSGVLHNAVKWTLHPDTTVDKQNKDIPFQVKAPDGISWTITTPASWMFANPASGSGNASGTLHISANGGTDDRTESVTLRGSNNITLVSKITQSTDTVVHASISRNGKVLTASAYGGHPPYSYSFNLTSYTSSNSYTLTFNGGYRVVVKDSKGKTDTATGCVDDVVIQEFSTKSYDPGYPDARGYLTVHYTSSLGLMPEFLQLTSGHYKIRQYLVVAGNNSDCEAIDLSSYCNGGGAVLCKLVSISEAGDDLDRTLHFIIPGGPNPVGGTTMTFRLYKGCGGEDICHPGQPGTWSKEYQVNW